MLDCARYCSPEQGAFGARWRVRRGAVRRCRRRATVFRLRSDYRCAQIKGKIFTSSTGAATSHITGDIRICADWADKLWVRRSGRATAATAAAAVAAPLNRLRARVCVCVYFVQDACKGGVPDGVGCSKPLTELYPGGVKEWVESNTQQGWKGVRGVYVTGEKLRCFNAATTLSPLRALMVSVAAIATALAYWGN